MDADRPQVREQSQAAAEREQRLLRPDRGRWIGPLRSADGAQEDRVGLAAGGDVLGPDGDAVRIDRRATHEVLGPVDREPEPGAGRVDDPSGGVDDLRDRRRRPGSSRSDR